MWPFLRRKATEHSPPVQSQAIERKASSVGALIFQRTLAMPQWASRNFDQVAKEGYQQNPIVYSCVWYTARACASVPLKILRGEGEIKVPNLQMLIDQPNPMQDGPSFRQASISDLLLAGETFLERVDVGKIPKELYRWQPGRVKVTPGSNGMPSGYVYTVGGKDRTVNVDVARGMIPILHVKDYHPTDDWRGMSPIDPAATAIDGHTNVNRWNKALLENGAQPTGALVYAPKEGSDQLTDEQFALLKAEIEDSFTGSRNAGKPLLLQGGMDWKEMGFSPREMNFVEGKNAVARDIALCMGTPPLLLGIPGDNTYANYQEANKAFYRQTVLPVLGQWCRSVSWWLCPSFGNDIRIAPDVDDLEVFADERQALWDRIEKSTILTVNEKRVALGRKPVPGGEVILVPSMMVPLDAAGTMPTGGAAPDEEDDDLGEDDSGDEDDGDDVAGDNTDEDDAAA